MEFNKETVLISLHPERYSNAIIFSKTEHDVTVLTDFGNLIHLPKTEFSEWFTVSPNWLEAKKIGYPLPSLEERITEQIALLEEAKKILNS